MDGCIVFILGKFKWGIFVKTVYFEFVVVVLLIECGSGRFLGIDICVWFVIADSCSYFEFFYLNRFFRLDIVSI